MNDENIEQQLRRLPAPELPVAWEREILAQARRAAETSSSKKSTWPAILLFLRGLFARHPLTAGALSVLWLVILLFHLTTPVDPTERLLIAQDRNPPSPEQLLALREELALLDQAENPPPDPSLLRP